MLLKIEKYHHFCFLNIKSRNIVLLSYKVIDNYIAKVFCNFIGDLVKKLDILNFCIFAELGQLS